MFSKALNLLTLTVTLAASFAVGHGIQLIQPRLAADPEIIYMIFGVAFMAIYLIAVVIWSVVGPVISARRFFELVFALSLAMLMGVLGYYGFPPWQ